MELSKVTLMMLNEVEKDFLGVSDVKLEYNDQVKWMENVMVIRLRARLLADRGETQTRDLGPATAWGMLWERYAPKWALMRWPVRRRRQIVVKPMILYPDGPSGRAVPDIEYAYTKLSDEDDVV